MNNELLPVVNEEDHIIDTRPRSEIHALSLRHRAVHILVFNLTGQLFLQKRAHSKDVNPGLWDTSAAGHVDLNESYDLCAVREINEELGLDITAPLEFLFKLPACKMTGMEFIQVYQCIHNGPFILQANEIDDGNWFSVNEISKRVIDNDELLTESFKLLWKHFLIHKIPAISG